MTGLPAGRDAEAVLAAFARTTGDVAAARRVARQFHDLDEGERSALLWSEDDGAKLVAVLLLVQAMRAHPDPELTDEYLSAAKAERFEDPVLVDLAAEELVGVGGGVVIVPGLEVVLGAGDLLAKGTSLLTMVPTSVSGTVANLRRRAVDLRVGLTVGTTAAVCSPGGAVLARLVDPQVGTWLFAAFLVVVAVIVLSRGRPREPQADVSDGAAA